MFIIVKNGAFFYGSDGEIGNYIVWGWLTNRYVSYLWEINYEDGLLCVFD